MSATSTSRLIGKWLYAAGSIPSRSKILVETYTDFHAGISVSTEWAVFGNTKSLGVKS